MNRNRLAALCAVLAIALVVVVVLMNRTDSEPTLLDESDFAGVQLVHQPSGQAPNWTFCASLAGIRGERVAGTYLSFGSAGDTLVASLIDGSTIGTSADDNLELVEFQAELCAEDVKDAVSGPLSIEPLTGLDEDSIGWRAESGDDVRGEYIAIKLDDWRVLAVGFETRESTPRVGMDELVRLAREGAAQFEPDAG